MKNIILILALAIALMASVSAHAAQPEDYQASPGCPYLSWHPDQNQWFWALTARGEEEDGNLFCEPHTSESVKCVDGLIHSLRIENDIAYFEGYVLPRTDDIITADEATCEMPS